MKKFIYELILICVVLVFTGCARIKYRDITYTRLGAQEIGGIDLIIIDPNGVTTEFQLRDQKSDFELGFEAAGIKAKVGE